jgi:SNF2 family DNA or RNA helicase
MGLGKTPISLAAMKLRSDWGPFLVLCKSRLKWQWGREIVRWCGTEFVPQLIDGSREKVYPGFKSYICSLDLLRRLDDKFMENVRAANIRTVIIDECQLIKNLDTQRTQAVRKLVKDIPHVIALSGTPIKNHAAEYFPVLNMLRPDVFPAYNRFVNNWVDTYWDGYKWKYGGVRNLPAFMQLTREFITRKERKEVLPELPQVTRNFQFHHLESTVEEAYSAVVNEFSSYYEENQGSNNLEFYSNTLAYLAKMRHLTGIAKIDPCVDFVEEFLLETDRKIVIFVHHHDVAKALQTRLAAGCETACELPPINIVGMNPDQADPWVQTFLEGRNRILIASTLASGEGLNLQACSDCVVLERQWNPANEEQAEARFLRIGQTSDKVNATYLIAVETVDEFLSELVEQKREYVTKSLGGEAVKWDETSIIRDLARIIHEKWRARK